MGRSPRYSSKRFRIAVLSAALPFSNLRTALWLPKTSRPMSWYIFSSSRRDTPLANPRAIIPPVLTPPIKSNSSCIGLPAARSSARNCQISARPLIPPPSRDKRRSPRVGTTDDAFASEETTPEAPASVAPSIIPPPFTPPPRDAARCLPLPNSARRTSRSNTRCTDLRHRISTSTSLVFALLVPSFTELPGGSALPELDRREG
mmetsp:Transcript_9063/g.30205  ORF Transcript_9063/g.30205 Transcript_9063/m.30205 type:complete len:204 (+) Transcript_9063:2355-2966(+)